MAAAGLPVEFGQIDKQNVGQVFRIYASCPRDYSHSLTALLYTHN